ncbi:MAG: hypothetical protein AAF581_06940 [Planctomycetota bacterium]
MGTSTQSLRLQGRHALAATLLVTAALFAPACRTASPENTLEDTIVGEADVQPGDTSQPPCCELHDGVAVSRLQDPPPCEPRPLDLLTLSRSEDPATIEIALFPSRATDGATAVESRLKVLTPSALLFDGGSDEISYTLLATKSTELLRLRTGDGRALAPDAEIAVQITLFGDDGTPTYVGDEVLAPETAPTTDSALRRVPVLFELADGRTIVEYMTVAEAARRQLTPVDGARVGNGAGQ